MRTKQNLRTYLFSNKKTLTLLALFATVFCLTRLLFQTVGFDTDEWLLHPQDTLTHWLELQRYSLVFLKYCFGTDASLLMLNIVTYINVYIYTVLFLYFLNIDSNESNTKKDVLCGFILISSPIFVEQYYFTLQSAEVSFSMTLIVISFIITYHLLSAGTSRIKKLVYGILILILLVFTFGAYQSFVNLYVIGVLICCYKLNRGNFRENICKILICFLLFLLALAGFFLLSDYLIQYFNLGESHYLSIQWFEKPFLSVLETIITAAGKVITGRGNVLNLSYTFCLIYIIYRIFKDKPLLCWRNFYFLALLASPFLLTFLTGTTLVIRSVLGFPLLCVFLFREFYDDSKLLKLGVYLTVLSQVIHSELLFYCDYARYQNDIAISEKILEDCGTENPVIVFKGLEPTPENIFALRGEASGFSFYQWAPANDGKNVAGERVRFFMKTQGMEFTPPTPEQLSLRDSIDFTAEYPNDGYIVEKDNVYYVNLGTISN